MEPDVTQRGATGRAATYAAVSAVVVLGYALLNGASWQGGAQLHTVMETVATVLAFFVGTLALVRYRAEKSNGYLFIGAGFLGTALLDGYHALVTSPPVALHLPSALPSLIPWSWTASRLFLSVMVLLALRASMREGRLGATVRTNERSVYVIGGGLALASFLFFALVPLPPAYYPELVFPRPEEFAAAALQLAALVGYLRRRAWRHDVFEHSLVLALIVGLGGQAVFMASSNRLFDLAFDGAHVLKIVSYGCVLFGLSLNMAAIFRGAGRLNIELQRQNAERQQAEMAIRESEDRYRRLVQLLPDGIMIVTDGKIVFANSRMAEIAGAESPNRLAGMTALDLVVPEERDRVNESRTKAIAGENLSLTEGQVLRLDGSRVHVERMPVAIQWEGAPSFLVMVRDVSERKQTEEALSESDRRYAAVAANIPGAIFQRVLHPDGRMTFPFLSPGVRETHGVDAEEAMADPRVLLRRMHPDDREDFREILVQSTKTLEPTSMVIRAIRPDGEIGWIWTRQRPRNRPDGAIVWDGIFVDVTDKKQTEQALAESEERYRKLLDLSPDAVYVHKTGRIVLINSAALRVFGATSNDQLVGRDSLDLIHPDDREEARARQRGAAKEGTETVAMEQRRLRIDGTEFDAEVVATAIEWDGARGGIVVVRDITEKKRAQERLRRAEALLRDALESIPDGVVLFDRDDKLLVWNRQFVDLYPELSALMAPGTSAEDMLRERVRCGAAGAINGPIEDYVRRHLEIRRSGGGTPFVHRHRDGRWLRTTERKTSEGGLVAITSDVTELKSNEADLITAMERAELANKAKSEFLANMSHEIRTPMNGVLGMVGVLLESDLTPEQRTQAEIIRQSGTALLAILNDILDLSKVEAGQMELETIDFDISDLLDTVDVLWRSELERRGLGFSIETDPDVETVLESDPTRIRQILFNLVGNAAKFTDKGGVKVRVSQRRHSDGALETRFDVSDTGIGISPDVQPLIFTKFAQADNSTTRKYGGTGLGLAICQQLAGLLGGDVGFDSVEGEGSKFWFTIRCRQGDPQLVDRNIFAAESHRTEPEKSVRSLNILVAEDNGVNQLVLRAMLLRAGHGVDIVDNGAEAISAVMRKPYDLVLMDIQMPEMDGVTATRRIRCLPGEAATVPIVALTANAMKGDRETYLDAGMTDYVPKPIDSDELMAAIARVMMTPDGGDAADRRDAWAADDRRDVSPILNLDVLNTLCHAVGDEAIPDLIVESVQEMRRIVKLIGELADCHDPTELRYAAHDLKSTSGAFGASRLQIHARELETACREDRADDARKLAGAVEPVAAEAFEALEAQADCQSPASYGRVVNE